MATHAADSRAGSVAQIVRLLAPSPGRLAFAARIALICALTALVVSIYGTPAAALTVYIVFFLNKADRTESLLLDVVFVVLMTLILGFTVLVAMVVIAEPVARLIAMTVIWFAVLFLTSASKLRPVGAIIALIVGYALDILGLIHGGEIATRALLYVWLFVAIPAGVSLVINLLIAPAPRKLAERAIGERLRVAASMLRAPDDSTRRAVTEYLRAGSQEILAWLKLAALEKSSPAHDLAALRQAAQSTTAILLWVDAADRCPDDAFASDLRGSLAQ